MGPGICSGNGYQVGQQGAHVHLLQTKCKNGPGLEAQPMGRGSGGSGV